MTGVRQGAAARVPVMIGTNHDEFTLFVALQYLRLGKRFTRRDSTRSCCRETFGANAAAVGGALSAGALRRQCAAGVFGRRDRRRCSPVWPIGWPRTWPKTEPVYAYEFNDRNAPAPDPLRTLAVPDRRQPFARAALPVRRRRRAAAESGPAGAVRSDDRLLEPVRHHGLPSVDGQPDWPAIADRRPENRLSLQPDGSRVITDFDETHQCAFWASLKRLNCDADSRPGQLSPTQWVRAWNAHDVEAVLDTLPRRRRVHLASGGACRARERGSGARQGGAARLLDDGAEPACRICTST